VNLRKKADLSGFRVVVDGSQVMLYSKDQALIDKTYAALRSDKDRKFEVYKRAETPESWHYRDNPRIGDLVVSATAPVLISAPPPDARPRPGPKGMHGYDPARFPEMRGIFFAQGPDLKSGLTIEPFENVNIYPLIVHLLNLDLPAGIDGSLTVLQPILREKAMVKGTK
jgi:predicted AlkP superfamily pyrophosphatase or phosphodiesterase